MKFRNCERYCLFFNERNQWRCHNTWTDARKKRKRRCGYMASYYKGSFLSGTRLEPWQILCFCQIWCSRQFSHTLAHELTGIISLNMSIAWWSFCSEFTEAWFEKQDCTGGDGIIVEIDETLIVRRNTTLVASLDKCGCSEESNVLGRNASSSL